MLLHSWVRRKRFEARILAAEVGRLLAGPTAAGRNQDRVSADAMIGMMGIKWQ